MRRSPFPLLFAVAFVFALSNHALARKVLTVTSEPSGARVEINGKLAGFTPIQEEVKEFYFNGPKYVWSEFLNTPIRMTVSKEGYVPQTILITSGPYQWLAAGYANMKIYYVISQTSFYVQLQKIGGYTETNPLAAQPPDSNLIAITISSEPSGAEISVDGEFHSSTPSRLRLAPGEHTVRVTRPGFKPWERKITLDVGDEKTLNALLESGTPGGRSATESPQAASGQKPELVAVTGHADSITAIAFSPDEKMLASGGTDGSIKLWDVKSGKGLRTFAEESLEASLADEVLGVYSLAFSPDGKILASATVKPDTEAQRNAAWKTDITLWDVASGRVLNAFSGVSGKVLSLAFSPDGRLLASGGADKTVTLWGVEGGKMRTFTGHVDEVNVVMFTPDGTEIFSGSWDKSIDFWYVANGTLLREIGGNPLFGAPSVMTGFYSRAKVAFNQATNRFASVAGYTGSIGLRDGTNMALLKEFKWDKSTVASIAFSQSGKRLAGASLGGGIKLWDVDTGTELLTIKEGQSNGVIAMSPDSKLIAQTSEGGNSIKLWDTNNETTMKILDGHTGDEINSLAFSPNSKILASGSDDKTIKLWEVESGRVKTLTGHIDAVGSVVFHPSGKMLASIADNIGDESDEDSEDKTVKFWDVENGKELKTLTVSSSAPTAIAFSPDGTVLAVGNHDGTISLLDLATGSVPKILSGNNGEVGSILFTNGETLQSISMDESETNVEINLWHVLSGKMLKTTKIDLSNVSNISKKETMFLGSFSFIAVSQNFYAMPFQGGITLFAKSAEAFEPTSQTGLASLYLFDDNDWLIMTPDGLFDGSPGAWKHVLWRFNNQTSDYGAVELYFNDFFYPNLLQSVLTGNTPKPPAGRTLEKIDRRQPKVDITAINGQSKTGVNAQAANQLRTDKRLAAITIEIADNLEEPKQSNHAASSGAQDLRLFRNGSLVRVWHDDLFKLGAKDGCEQIAPAKPDEPRRVRCRAEVPVVAGENQFTAYAFNREKVKSEDGQFLIRGADTLKRARTLYVLAVGVGQYENPQYNLSYAVTDAQDFGAEVRRQQELIGYYQRVEVVPLLNQAAKKADILAALKRLAGTVQPEDGVIVYFSGHGTAQGDRFYLIPSDIGYKGSRSQVDAASVQTILAHSISDLELEAAFRDIDAGRLLLVIDACNSGKALQAEDWRRGPMNTKGLGQLAYEKGMYVLTASQDVELAYESEALKHSYLTYALVEEGLKLKVREADANVDGLVLLREWFGYATQRVPRMREDKVEQNARQQNKSLEEVEVVEQGKVQQPRVFYRREPELQPFIVAKPGAAR